MLPSEIKTIKSVKSYQLVLVIQLVILLFLILVPFLYSPNNLEFLGMLQPEQLVHSGCTFFLVLVIWSFWSWKLVTSRWFDPYLLFFLSAVLFNGGQAILEVFHLNEHGFLAGLLPEELFSYEVTLQTLYLVTLGLATLHFGALIGVIWANQIEKKEENPKEIFSTKQFSRNAYLVGRVFLYASLLPTFLTMKNALSAVFSGGYESLFEQGGVTGVGAAPALIAKLLFPGAFLVIATAPKNDKIRIQAVFFILLYSAANFVLGSRNNAVMPLLAMLWLWNSVVRPIPKFFSLGILLLLSFILPIIASTRNDSGIDRFSIEFLQQAFAGIKNPIIESISEMGGSMRSVAWTMELVPNVRPFALGMTYLVGFMVLIPNIFGVGRHPALTISGYDIPDFWLVSEIDPDFFERGGSFGFSFIAEAFLNFGWGAPIALGLIGLIYGKYIGWSLNDRNPVKIALAATFASFFLFYARQASELMIRPSIYYVLVPYLLIKFLSARAVKSSNQNIPFP